MTVEDVESYDQWLADNAVLVAKRFLPDRIERIWKHDGKYVLTARLRNAVDSPTCGLAEVITYVADGKVVSSIPVFAYGLSQEEVDRKVEEYGWDVL
jgi:hypothetical protein